MIFGIFPKPHLVLSAVLSLIMLAVAVVQPDHGRTESIEATAGTSGAPQQYTPHGPLTQASLVPDLTLPLRAERLLPPLVESPVAPPAADPAAASGIDRLAHRVKSLKVKPGDSLSVIFKREGISSRDVHRLVTSQPLGKRLKNIYPGHALTVTQADDGTLLKLAYTPGPLETLEFERIGEEFVGREVVREPERNAAYKHGVIDHSLFVASQRAGLPDGVTMRLAQIFQWDVDFVLDIRRGDEFHVVYEELYVGDEFVGYGDILAAEFVNQGESFQAIRYTDAEGHSDYFDPSGDSMRKAFLRAPVEFSRISSNFNLQRVHPLHKRNMPHRGIDYAAPTGTPILAAGDGRVVKATRTDPNGNYVVIQHGEQFMTKYLHLSKFGRGIKSGVRVRQGQVIGYVGATGWATGPHLHYEFLVNGVHQNPRTVPLPDAQPIPAKELPRFNQRAEPLLAMLNDFKEQVQLAAAR